jgi:uncharacterized protein YdcH (DUF465 family)
VDGTEASNVYFFLFERTVAPFPRSRTPGACHTPPDHPRRGSRLDTPQTASRSHNPDAQRLPSSVWTVPGGRARQDHDRRSAMFENRRDKMEVLLKESREFRWLYNRHQQLEKRVTAAENNTAPLDDMELNQLKRRKLQAKDKLSRIMDRAPAG